MQEFVPTLAGPSRHASVPTQEPSLIAAPAGGVAANARMQASADAGSTKDLRTVMGSLPRSLGEATRGELYGLAPFTQIEGGDRHQFRLDSTSMARTVQFQRASSTSRY